MDLIFKKKEIILDIDSKFSIDSYDHKLEKRNSTKEAKSIVSKIIEAKTAFAAEPMRDDFIYTSNSVAEKEPVVQNKEESKPETAKRPKGRPRKPIDPNAPVKEKRPKGRPRKVVDPNAPVKEKRPKGRPRKPIDPNAPVKEKRPKGRPRKPIDPNAPAKIKRPKGRPRKNADTNSSTNF